MRIYDADVLISNILSQSKRTQSSAKSEKHLKLIRYGLKSIEASISLWVYSHLLFRFRRWIAIRQRKEDNKLIGLASFVVQLFEYLAFRFELMKKNDNQMAH